MPDLFFHLQSGLLGPKVCGLFTGPNQFDQSKADLHLTEIDLFRDIIFIKHSLKG